jgi:hypothetical protein
MMTATMDRALSKEHLAQAERHVAQGERTVARQEELVARLERDGHDVRMARELLIQFQELLEAHRGDRDQLRKELGLR